MKLTKAKLKQMILNEMSSKTIDPTAIKLADKFEQVGGDQSQIINVFEIAVTLGHAQEGMLDSIPRHENFGGGTLVTLVASSDLAQEIQKRIGGTSITPDNRFPGMFKVEYVI